MLGKMLIGPFAVYRRYHLKISKSYIGTEAGEAVGSTSANEIEAAARMCHATALNSADGVVSGRIAGNANVRLPRARVECEASTHNVVR
jgi:hypothetical protein